MTDASFCFVHVMCYSVFSVYLFLLCYVQLLQYCAKLTYFYVEWDIKNLIISSNF